MCKNNVKQLFNLFMEISIKNPAKRKERNLSHCEKQEVFTRNI